MATAKTLNPRTSAPSQPASAPAPSHTPTPAQIAILKSTVPILAQHGEAITTLFYSNLLSANPELKAIFNLANQANKRQPRALAGALYAYAANIDNPAALTGAVELIAHRHASLYVRPEHYESVGTYLLAAMREVLGDALTPEVLEAWTVAYWQLADLFIAREKQLYADGGEWADWREFRIARKVKESDEITSFYLEPVDGKPLPPYKPGQFLSIRTMAPQMALLQPRQYSLSDAPNGKYYRISVKREGGEHPGLVSNLLHYSRNEGDVVDVAYPYGDFFFDTAANAPDAPVVLLSAGVGLTSVTSIFNSLISRESTRPITFVHGARHAEARAFLDHYRKASEKPNVKVVLFNKNVKDGEVQGKHYDHSGRVDMAKLDKDADLHLSDARTNYFVCGPESFMANVEKTLRELGVDEKRIHSEMYGPKN